MTAPEEVQASGSLSRPAAPATLNVASAGNAGADMMADPDQSSGLVDLNTASLERLNVLRGGGLIGRAIIRGRPYASVEDLVTKRVIRRSIYERIKDQVTAR